MQNSPKVSVIIPSYNGEATVRDCLDSLLALDFSNYEVIVIDCSADNTPKIIKEEFPQVKLLFFSQRINWVKARKAGIQEASGDYLFFACIDCVIEKDSISKAIKLFETDKELKGLCFAIKNYSKASVIETVDFLLEHYYWLPCQKRKTFAKYLSGCSSVYKKEIFLNNKYEEFDSYGEDIILSLRLANQGYKLSFEPSINVTHINIKDNFSSFIKHQFRVGAGSALVRKKADKSFRVIFLKFPILIFITPFYVVPKMGLTYLIRDDFDNFWFFLRFSPLFFIGNFFWAAGFFKEAIS